MAVKEENGVFLVWSSSTRARQSRNRRNCNHSATIEVQEAPNGTRTGLTSVQGALAVLLVASQLVAFAQLPEAHGESESAPAAGAGPAGAAAEATAVAAAPGRKMTSSGSSSSTEATEAASGGSGGSSRNNGSSNGSSSTRTRSSIRIKSSIVGQHQSFFNEKGVRIKGMDQGYGSRVWIMQYHGVWIGVWIMEYGSCVGPGPWSMLCIFTRIQIKSPKMMILCVLMLKNGTEIHEAVSSILRFCIFIQSQAMSMFKDMLETNPLKNMSICCNSATWTLWSFQEASLFIRCSMLLARPHSRHVFWFSFRVFQIHIEVSQVIGATPNLIIHDLAVGQNLVPLVNIKIAGKWMFIPLKMVWIGIDS